MGHESSLVCTNSLRRGTTDPDGRVALLRRLHHASQPNTARLQQRPTPLRDSSQSGLFFADGTQRHQRLPLRRTRLSQAQVAPTKECAAYLRPGEVRAATSHPAPKSSHLQQAHFCMDASTRCRGLFRAGSDRAVGEHRAHTSYFTATRRRVAASQRLDYLSRPRVYTQKKRRDTLIAGALRRAEQGWVVGYGDEVWWSRFAQPRMHAWAEQGKPLRLQEFEAPKSKAHKDNLDPKALCCYGLLREDTGQMLLRFVDGRPVSHVSTAYLEWVCERLAAEGKRVLVLIWDNASWHISREVRNWIRGHNLKVLSDRRAGKPGTQLIPCFLPTKSPWLNNIEPKWIHGKRAIAEPDSVLPPQQLATRICDYFGSHHHEHLKQIVS